MLIAVRTGYFAFMINFDDAGKIKKCNYSCEACL